MAELRGFFGPESTAVIGATDSEGKIGQAVMKNILESKYEGELYPVNPNRKEVMGLTSYSCLKEIGEAVEMAVIVVPSQLVNRVAREAGEIGVKYLIVITAGFKEVGSEGKRREKELLEICSDYNMRILGPNCVGMMDTHTPINLSFARGFPERGHITFISQSGAMLLSILDWSREVGLGFSKFISLGNKSDLSEADFIAAAAHDEETKVILCYIEDVASGDYFLEVVRRASREKPVIILKSGSSQAGARAASSHTGALAGSDRAYEVAFKQAGILRARTMEELFDLAESFSRQPLPQGDRVAVVTNAGGPGIVTTDWIEEEGLKMASFERETIDALREDLPPEAGFYNPVDVLGDAKAHRFSAVLSEVLKDKGVDGVIVLLCPAAPTEPKETAEAIVEAQRSFPHKPIFAAYMGGESLQEGVQVLSRDGIPCYTFPERAVRAFSGMVTYSAYRQKVYEEEEERERKRRDTSSVKAVLFDVIRDHRTVLLGSEATAIALAYGIPATPIKLAKTAQEAVEIADSLGYPVVLKVASPKILHKTDVGGVRMGLKDGEEVENGFLEIMNNVQRHFEDTILYGVEVQAMAPKGKEIIIGMNRDLQFGPLIAFGLGGIYVNLLEDVSFRISNGLHRGEILEMMKETKAYSLLKGYRGEEPSDVEVVIEIIDQLALLCKDFPEIHEVDLNPVFIYGEGAAAVDVKMTINWDGS